MPISPKSGAAPSRALACLLALAAPATGGGPGGPSAAGAMPAIEAPGPGQVVTLRVGEAPPPGASTRWVQTRGPSAELLDPPTAPEPRVRLSGSPGAVEFLRIDVDARGVTSTPVAIRVPGGSPESPLADAGGPVQGVVGVPALLDGSRSAPRGGLAYRWIQVAGPVPEPVELEQSGPTATFVPKAAGPYRFLLVVASDRAISEPSAVDVLVAPPPPPTIGEVARSALAAIEGGPQAGPALAEAFEALAVRMDLYASYAELYREMSGRLAEIVPEEPARREAWLQRLFVPLTARLIDGLRARGLDLTRAEAPATPLTDDQKDALAAMLRGIAEGCRDAGASGGPPRP